MKRSSDFKLFLPVAFFLLLPLLITHLLLFLLSLYIFPSLCFAAVLAAFAFFALRLAVKVD